MEHENVFNHKAPELEQYQRELLSLFLSELLKADQKFNLTGLHEPVEVIEKLLLGSYRPLSDINVPRGTIVADMGAGQGVPGIVLGICRPDLKMNLMESNKKRVAFLRRMQTLLSIDYNVIEGRIEELAHKKEHREKYGLVVSRAFAPPGVAVECGSALLALKGILYIYADANENALSSSVIDHAATLGMEVATPEERIGLKLPDYGYVFKKNRLCDAVYPRRFAVMKREARRLQEAE